MGYFSSKKKTYVYSSATRMMDDEDIVNASQQAITNYILRNTLQTDTTLKEMSIVDYMNEATLNNLSAKWGRVRQRAIKDNYVYGVPTSNIILQENTDFNQEVIAMLEASGMNTVELIYAYADEMNYYHILMQKLVSQYGWNPSTNEITSLSTQIGKKVYLKDIVMRYPTEFLEDVVDDDLMSQWGYAATSGATHVRNEDRLAEHTPWEEDTSITEVIARVTTTSELGDVVMDVGFRDYEPTSDYIMVSYLAGGELKYFTGYFGTGEYPRLDQLYMTSISYGEFYPRMYARLNTTNLAADSLKETDAYKSCQQLWRTTDLNWAEWVDVLHDNLGDVGDITQAFVTCAIPANTDDQDQLEYLFKWFNRIYKSQEKKRTPSVQDTFPGRKKDIINNSVRDGMSLVIQDNVYTQVVAFRQIGFADYEGKVTDVGKYNLVLDKVRDTSRRSGFLGLRAMSVHRYQYQVTESTYRVISVYGLSSTEYVTGGNTVVSAGNSESLLIPVDATMAREMSNRDYEVVMSKGLHIIVNTLKVVKTKWYQRGAFKVVMFIVAVIIAVWTGGAGWGLMAFVKAIAMAVAVSVVVTLATKLLIKLGVAVEIVMVVAVIAALVSGYVQFNQIGQLAGMSARTIAQISNVALQVQANMTQYELQSLAKQMQNLSTEHEQRMQELQELQDEVAIQSQLLDNSLFVAPDFSGAFIKLGESPDDYYTRTIHAGSLGPAVIDVTLGSIEQMLKLPTPQQTLNTFQGGN